MKLIDYQFSQVTRLSTFMRQAGQLYIPDALAEFQQRYGFVEAPKTLTDWNSNNGVTFQHGKFKDTAISKFSLYSDGVVAHASAPVEVVEQFVDDAVIWAEQSLQFEEISSLPSVQLFDSQVIVQCAVDFGSTLQKIEAFGRQISSLLDLYGVTAKPYKIAGIGLQNDVPDAGMYRTAKFTFERKFDKPFSQNLYFSSAPLRSKDHLELLAQLERTFAT